MGRPYSEDTRIVDVQSGDQMSFVCRCGHSGLIAWARLPQSTQELRLPDLRAKMICKRCGARRPTITIAGMVGTSGRLSELLSYP